MPSQNFTKRKVKLNAILTWDTSKPADDSEWCEDVKAESFDLKFDNQLEEMRLNCIVKFPFIQKELDKFNNFPDAVKFELDEQFSEEGFDLEGKSKQQWIDDEFVEQKLNIEWKVQKLKQSITRLENEQRMRASGFLTVLEKQGSDDKRFDPKTSENEAINARGSRERAPLGTTFFVDDTCATPGNGSTATCVGGANDSFDDLDDFMEASRSAGDICIVRRDNTSIDNGSDIVIVSDGTIGNPIIVEADYDDNWSSNVDLNATASATLTFGSKTVTFSADISGVLAAGDWIYVTAEDQRVFAYEVDTVVTTTVTLFLPYKGNEAGSGKAMTNMQAAPIWNIITGDFQWVFNADNYWKVQGLHLRGTDSNGLISLNTTATDVFRDMIFEGNGTTVKGIFAIDDQSVFIVDKSRFFNLTDGMMSSGGAGGMNAEVRDSLFDGNSAASSVGLNVEEWSVVECTDSEFKNHATADILLSTRQGSSARVRSRNCILSSTTEVGRHDDSGGAEVGFFFSEDHDGVLGDTRQLTYLSSAEGTPIIQSDTGTTRTGGSNISIKVTPSTKLGTVWEHSRQLLLEIPFYATTASRTYEIFFRPTATADWTTDPTASELWIELEYWGHATNNFRRITRSTGVIDMNGSTAFVALSVVVAPAQAGVAYLRAYYAKTKESAKANTFFVDPIPVVT